MPNKTKSDKFKIMQIKQVALLGAGAIGILPAAEIVAAKVPLQVIASGERLQRYRQQGLYLNGTKLPLEFAAPEEATAADLVIVATKTVTLADALPQLRRAVNSNTIIPPLLNGISSKAEIEKHFPEATVLYGLFIGHASGRENNQICHDGVGTLCFGMEKNEPQTPAVAAVSQLFTACGIDHKVPPDMLQTVWQKFVINVGINQTQAYFKADYGMVQQSREMLKFAETLMQEAVAIAEKLNISGCDRMIANAMELIMSIPPQAKTSMLQDVLAGRPTEVDAFAGTVIELGKKLSIPTPANSAVALQLKK